jgi:hypothetical protein
MYLSQPAPASLPSKIIPGESGQIRLNPAKKRVFRHTKLACFPSNTTTHAETALQARFLLP